MSRPEELDTNLRRMLDILPTRSDSVFGPDVKRALEEDGVNGFNTKER